jgi:hypothetical protein
MAETLFASLKAACETRINKMFPDCWAFHTETASSFPYKIVDGHIYSVNVLMNDRRVTVQFSTKPIRGGGDASRTRPDINFFSAQGMDKKLDDIFNSLP